MALRNPPLPHRCQFRFSISNSRKVYLSGAVADCRQGVHLGDTNEFFDGYFFIQRMCAKGGRAVCEGRNPPQGGKCIPVIYKRFSTYRQWRSGNRLMSLLERRHNGIFFRNLERITLNRYICREPQIPGFCHPADLLPQLQFDLVRHPRVTHLLVPFTLQAIGDWL